MIIACPLAGKHIGAVAGKSDLGQRTCEARTGLEDLVRRYPGTVAADDAEKLLGTIK